MTTATQSEATIEVGSHDNHQRRFTGLATLPLVPLGGPVGKVGPFEPIVSTPDVGAGDAVGIGESGKPSTGRGDQLPTRGPTARLPT